VGQVTTNSVVEKKRDRGTQSKRVDEVRNWVRDPNGETIAWPRKLIGRRVVEKRRKEQESAGRDTDTGRMQGSHVGRSVHEGADQSDKNKDKKTKSFARRDIVRLSY